MGLGVWSGLLKLFPFLLLPGFLLAEHARTGRWVTCRRPWPAYRLPGLRADVLAGQRTVALSLRAQQGFESERPAPAAHIF